MIYFKQIIVFFWTILRFKNILLLYVFGKYHNFFVFFSFFIYIAILLWINLLIWFFHMYDGRLVIFLNFFLCYMKIDEIKWQQYIPILYQNLNRLWLKLCERDRFRVRLSNAIIKYYFDVLLLFLLQVLINLFYFCLCLLVLKRKR